MPVQFQYPEEMWSQGRMRKRGEKVYMKMGPQEELNRNLADMDRSAGAGIAARGGQGVVGSYDISGVVSPKKLAESMFNQHKEQIQEGVNQVAQGTMSMGALSKLLKKLGWGRVEKTGEFTDPDGNAHVIEPQKTEQADANGPQRNARP